MKSIIQFLVSKEDGVYTAVGVNIPIVTDSATFEVLTANLREAVDLYFDDEDPAALGFDRSPSILASFELTPSFQEVRY